MARRFDGSLTSRELSIRTVRRRPRSSAPAANGLPRQFPPIQFCWGAWAVRRGPGAAMPDRRILLSRGRNRAAGNGPVPARTLRQGRSNSQDTELTGCPGRLWSPAIETLPAELEVVARPATASYILPAMRRFLLSSMALLVWSAEPMIERQLTFSPITKALDNNDNFSIDGKYLVYDTRDTAGPGPANSTRIMKVSIGDGVESDLYRPPSVTGEKSAPGVAAASWSPIANEVIFIHGPLLDETERLGYYGFTNRRGAVVSGDGTGKVRFVDCRDVASPATPAGAHRGGTHRHEFSADGKRIGFTYDDHLLTAYGRNLGMLVPHEKAPCGVTHYFTVLLPIVPAVEAAPGDLVRAADDSWVGAQGLMRAFIGTVKQAGGQTATSLFAVDIPADVDVTSADPGSATRYPRPPKGLQIRRLVRDASPGIVRGSPDGSRIAYYANDGNGVRQVFLIHSHGSDEHGDPGMRPIQATSLPAGAAAGLRWHPSGRSIAVLSEDGVAVTCVQPGPLFGKSIWLTRHGAGARPAEALVWSPDGRLLAFNRRVPALDAAGRPVKDATGKDFRQIFLVNFPDTNRNGIADPTEQGH